MKLGIVLPGLRLTSQSRIAMNRFKTKASTTTTTLSPVMKTLTFAAAGLTLAAGVKRWRSALT